MRPADMEEMCPYEEARSARVAENKALMVQLGIEQDINAMGNAVTNAPPR